MLPQNLHKVQYEGVSTSIYTFVLGPELASAVVDNLSEHLVSCNLNKGMPGTVRLLCLPFWMLSVEREVYCPVVQTVIGPGGMTFWLSSPHLQ